MYNVTLKKIHSHIHTHTHAYKCHIIYYMYKPEYMVACTLCIIICILVFTY